MLFERLCALSRPRWALAVLLGSGLAVYWNALFAGFVWDDQLLLLDNARLHSLHALFGQFFNTQLYYFRPVTDVMLAALYGSVGPSPLVFHLFQIGAHCAVVISLYFLLRKLFGSGAAFALSFLFLIHPINVEAVTNIESHGETISALFGILALLSLLGEYSLFRMLATVFFLALALFTKESAFVFFIVAPIFLYTVSRRYSMTLMLGSVGLIALRLLYHSGVPYYSAHEYPEIAMVNASFLERMLTVPQMTWYYLHTLLYPDTLAIWQNWIVRTPGFSDFFLPLMLDLVFAAALLAGFLWLYRTGESRNVWLYTTFFLLFALSMGVHLQLVPLDMTVAERWFYTPFIGLLGMAGCLLKEIRISKRAWTAVIFIFILSCAGYAARTIVRNDDWQDALALYGHDLLSNDSSCNLLVSYASELPNTYNAAQQSVPLLLRAIAMCPESLRAHGNLGYAYLAVGNLADAVVEFRRAMAIGQVPQTYRGLVMAYLRLPDRSRAFRFALLAAHTYPQEPVLWDLLAVAAYEDGRPQVNRQAVEISRDTRSWSADQGQKAAAAFAESYQSIPPVIHIKSFSRFSGGLQ